jgi:hypothetical protein
MQMEDLDLTIITEKTVDFAFEVGPSLILALITLFAGLYLIKFFIR